MRILFLAPKECVPADTGAKLRTFHLARELAKKAQVVFLSFAQDGANRTPEAEHAASALTAPFEHVLKVHREGSYRISDLVKGTFGDIPFSVLNWNRQSMTAMLERLLVEMEFDAVQVESIQLAGYLPLLRNCPSKPAIFCDSHNIESELMFRYAQSDGNPAKRFYARLTAPRLQRFEAQMLPRFDAHVTVSGRDRDQLRAMCPDSPVFVVENGVDFPYYSAVRSDPAPVRNRVLYVGSMDYHSNIGAVLFFARKVWPLVRERAPELVFTIVGSSPVPEVRALAKEPGVEVTGTVPDMRPYLREALAEVVPLRVGGGTRLKILEAMAARVPVISTRIGAEGLDVTGRDVLFAESEQDFAESVLQLHGDAQLRTRLSDGGEQLVRSHHDWKRLGEKLWDAHEAIQEERLGKGVAAPAR